LPKTPLAASQPIPHRVKDIRAVFLERQNIIASKDETHLFDHNVPSLRKHEHLHDQKEIGLIVIELRALVCIGDVFQKKWVETELFSEDLQNIDLMYSTDIHPRDGFVGRQPKLIHVCNGMLLASSTCIVEQGNSHSLGSLFTDVNERSGRESRLLGSFLHQFHRNVLVRRFWSQVKQALSSFLFICLQACYSSIMTWDYERDVLIDVIRKAGKEALRFVVDGFETIQKPDQSPVTSADLAVNQTLQSRLMSAFPQDGWLSEESPDGLDRLQKRRVWVVDPIDGTKAFISGEPEFCISVALIELGQPVVASIFNPSTDELFTATRGEGLRLNDAPVVPPAAWNGQHPVIALNSWERRIGRFTSLEPSANNRPIRSIAWVLALTAIGRIEAVATLESENEWDVAAGALLIAEAGGTISDGRGHDLTFNRREPRYSGIIATSPSCPDALTKHLKLLTRTVDDGAE
jgi:myo-inositol-1(or 4)-monophosphatase